MNPALALVQVDAAGAVNAPPRRRAFMYTRVSEDTSGRGRSPEEQRDDMIPRAASWGLDIVKEYRDMQGASRYTNGGRLLPRPDFEELLADLESGRFLRAGDVVMAWHEYRLTRDPSEMEQLIRILRTTGVHVIVGFDELDMDIPEHEARMANAATSGRLVVGQNRMASMRSLRTNANRGLPHGTLLWGYRRDYVKGRLVGQVPDPETAPYVQELFRRVAAGHALQTIVRDFNRRGVAPPAGPACPPECDERTGRGDLHRHRRGTWSGNGASTLRRLLRSRAYLGERWHKDRLANTAAWEPLVTVEQFEAAAEALADPSRITNAGTSGRSAVRHLLSGLMDCAVCGERCQWVDLKVASGRTIYRCKFGMHTSVTAPAAEAVVIDATLARLSDPVVLDAMSNSHREALRAARDELAGINERLAELKAAALDVTRPSLTLADFEVAADGAAGRVEELTATIATLSRPVPKVLAKMAGEHAVRAFGDASLADRRIVIAALFPRIALHRADEGPERIALASPDGTEIRLIPRVGKTALDVQ